MAQELERLQENLKAKQDQIARLDQIARSQSGELQGWRKKYTDLEANSRHTIEVEVTKNYAIYEQNILELKTKNGEFEGKIIGAMQEIERLNNVLRLKVDQSVQLTSKVNSLNNDLEETRRKLREVDSVSSQNVNALKNEREQLLRRTQEWELKWRQSEGSVERRIVEYENKIKVMNQEIERLSENLRSKAS